MSKHLLSCDWGTSSFRLRLVNLKERDVVGEVTSSDGIGTVYSAWQEARKGGELESGQADAVPRGAFYRSVIATQVAALSRQTGIDLASVPIVLSGMASSSIGMRELPYARLPFALDGSHLGMRQEEEEPDFPHEITLISGVRSDHDVMRGEETQLIGLSAAMDLSGRDAIFIFPGTHSKHMFVRDGRLIDFKTFMTGEVFNLMANQSILKDSIDHYLHSDFKPEAAAAFREGIRESGSGNILNALFTVRTNQLFDLFSKRDNGMFLSGLLIGYEIRDLTRETNAHLVLCGGNNLYQLYKAAIETLGLSGRATIIPSEIVDRAATTGHIRIFENQYLTLNKANL
ncbi:putative 2-dehydro-3-deoxygalactonokinase DgoK1 [Dyadobacter beijingensis]|uniref:2-dehydro-3-deoxygalactonokinase DgoK1 n=1 Tax=Dyadobacter beijingensis TaxID=365489 RepID=A0ABQ2HTM5_9BACT|nr:2-dehydro-3-deoxygalactonokinase [Dyadobacter beijingensis]GGM91191.1 putative 2-dehydro-3-deoxygalactonokinase DgoK1 [Dyadobacter beijingensis]